jgi:hypothetical protein
MAEFTVICDQCGAVVNGEVRWDEYTGVYNKVTRLFEYRATMTMYERHLQAEYNSVIRSGSEGDG